MALPTLSVGNRAVDAMGALLRSQKDTALALRADTEQGLHYGDVSKIGRTPEEQKFLGTLEREGAFHSNMADEFGRLNAQQSAFARGAGGAGQRVLNLWGSNISAADRFTRIPAALAAFRMASEPGGFAKFAKAWGNDENFKQTVARYGQTPEAVGRFMSGEAAFEYGKRNMPAWQRSVPGRLIGQFHGFQFRAFSKMIQLTSRLGPEGKKAAAYMGLAVMALAGVSGLPFSQDIQNGYDWLHKQLTGKGSNVHADMQKWMEEKSGMGRMGADMVLRGPVSTSLGVDLTDRLGFGDPISREAQDREMNPWEWAGAAPGIIANSIGSAVTRARSGQGDVAAGSELLPNAIKNPVKGLAIWPQQGVRSVAGGRNGQVVPARQITPADQARKAAGFEPLDVTRAYEKRENAYRAKQNRRP
jgi:hypothetical protein